MSESEVIMSESETASGLGDSAIDISEGDIIMTNSETASDLDNSNIGNLNNSGIEIDIVRQKVISHCARSRSFLILSCSMKRKKKFY